MEKIYATEKELAEIQKRWENAQKTPVITFQVGAEDLASVMRRIVINRIHELAAEHGCPDNGKPWGRRLDTGEFTQEDA